MQPATILTLIIILTAIALLLITKGLIGKRISNQPHCKKCKYNLAATTTSKCPECGNNTSKPKAIQSGLRKKNKKIIYLGLTLLTLTLTPPIYSAATTFNLNPYKPIWMLNIELNATSQERNEAATVELLTRITTNKLTHQDFDTYLDFLDTSTNNTQQLKNSTPALWLPKNHILLLYAGADENSYTPKQTKRLFTLIKKIQNNKNYNWDTNLGNIFMHLKHQGHVDQKQWIAFLQNAFTDRILIPDQVVLDDKALYYKITTTSLPYQIAPPNSPNIIPFTPKTKVNHPSVKYNYDHTDLYLNNKYRGYNTPTSWTRRSNPTILDRGSKYIDLSQDIVKPGKNTFSTKKLISITDPSAKRRKLIHAFTHTAKKTFTTLPKGTIQLVKSTDPQIEKIINQNIMLSDIKLIKNPPIIIQDPNPNIIFNGSSTITFSIQNNQSSPMEIQELRIRINHNKKSTKTMLDQKKITKETYSKKIAQLDKQLEIYKNLYFPRKPNKLNTITRKIPDNYQFEFSHLELPIDFIYTVKLKQKGKIIHSLVGGYIKKTHQAQKSSNSHQR